MYLIFYGHLCFNETHCVPAEKCLLDWRNYTPSTKWIAGTVLKKDRETNDIQTNGKRCEIYGDGLELTFLLGWQSC